MKFKVARQIEAEKPKQPIVYLCQFYLRKADCSDRCDGYGHYKEKPDKSQSNGHRSVPCLGYTPSGVEIFLNEQGKPQKKENGLVTRL